MRRQMRRAQLASLHNKRVMDAGTGDVWDVRSTDVNEALCRRRYQVFKARRGGCRSDCCCFKCMERAAACTTLPLQVNPPPLPARATTAAGAPRCTPPHPAPPSPPSHTTTTHPQAHYHTILRLKTFFPFSLIDAMGTLEEARQQIMRELRYQSSLDLDEATYAAIRHLPLARDLVRVARQRLVFRLDSYCKRHNELFSEIIE